MDLNIHHVPKVCIGVNLGFNDHHPGNNIFFTHPSATPLIRDNYEVPPDATFCQFFCFLKKECLHVSALWKLLHPLLMPRSRMLLTVSAVLAAAIQDGFKDKVEFMRYDVPAAFLQRLLLRKFKITYPNNSNIFVILNTHVDDGGAVLTWRPKYDETLQALRNRYPGTLDSTTMDRYLGMGFSFNSSTGVTTASMYHSVVKILATFRASSLPVQRTPYTMDLFDPSDDLTPVDEKIYQKLVGMLIWTLKLRF